MTSNRKKRKRVHEPGHFHELTFSCFRNMPLLTNHVWQKKLASLLSSACILFEIELTSFVFMPSHVHLLIYPKGSQPEIGRFLASFKQPFSKYVKQLLMEHKSPLLPKLTVRERPGKTCFRLWQEGGGYDRNLFEATAIEASLTYIHLNPVRKHLCKKSVDWKWSSARHFDQGLFDSDLPTLSGLPPEMFDKGGVQVPNL